MPKKIDYHLELKGLKGLADNALRPMTTRLSVGCLRKLYQLCDRDGLDLSGLVRQILEEQADLYLEARRASYGQAGPGRTAMLAGKDTNVLVQLPEEISILAEKAREGLAMELPVLLQLIITDAMPGWVMKARKARQQRRQALDHLENELTPAQAAWQTYFRLAPARFLSDFRLIDDLIEEGRVKLELTTEAVLYLVLDFETTVALDNRTAEHPGITGLQNLINSEVLLPERLHEGSGSKWRVEPHAFSSRTNSKGSK